MSTQEIKAEIARLKRMLYAMERDDTLEKLKARYRTDPTYRLAVNARNRAYKARVRQMRQMKEAA